MKHSFLGETFGQLRSLVHSPTRGEWSWLRLCDIFEEAPSWWIEEIAKPYITMMTRTWDDQLLCLPAQQGADLIKALVVGPPIRRIEFENLDAAGARALEDVLATNALDAIHTYTFRKERGACAPRIRWRGAALDSLTLDGVQITGELPEIKTHLGLFGVEDAEQLSVWSARVANLESLEVCARTPNQEMWRALSDLVKAGRALDRLAIDYSSRRAPPELEAMLDKKLAARLSCLDLAGARLEEALPAILSPENRIRSLALQSHEAIATLGEQETSLETIWLQTNRNVARCDRALATLATLPLKSFALDARRYGLSPLQWENVLEIACSTGLEHLELHTSDVDAEVGTFAHGSLASDSRLETIRLTGRFSRQAMTNMLAAVMGAPIKTLDIHTILRGAGLRYRSRRDLFRVLSSFTQLRELSLLGVCIQQSDLPSLRALIEHTSLHRFAFEVTEEALDDVLDLLANHATSGKVWLRSSAFYDQDRYMEAVEVMRRAGIGLLKLEPGAPARGFAPDPVDAARRAMILGIHPDSRADGWRAL